MVDGLYHRVFVGLLAAVALVIASGCSSEGHLIQRYESAQTDSMTGTDKPMAQATVSEKRTRRVLFIAGRDSHGPMAHEHQEGSKLLAASLHAARPEFAVDVVYGGWPVDPALLRDLDALVIYCDGGEGHVINDHLSQFSTLLDEGVGVAALHYAVEVPKGSASATALMRAIGGYFETDWSVNPHWEANFATLPEHPITRGIAPFTMLDEWYFNMRFVDAMDGVTPLLSAVAPEATMSRKDGPHSGNPHARKLVAEGAPQVVAWAYQRPDGGRGFGYTGGHFHANWEEASARELVLNAIVWVAQGQP